ncbi:MAG: hypothetical protein PWQ44_1260 [Methanolobus sp.]|jgi:hypothetical protein|nr:hypothetical protein [Methanolobus sp.]
MNSKKMFVLVLLLVFVAAAGCLAESQVSRANVESSNYDGVLLNENMDRILDSQIVGSEPIKFSSVNDSKVYWDWHHHTSDMLEERIGKKITVYSHSLSYSGELKEVSKYYILMDDYYCGLVYVDIDRITAISDKSYCYFCSKL